MQYKGTAYNQFYPLIMPSSVVCAELYSMYILYYFTTDSKLEMLIINSGGYI